MPPGIGYPGLDSTGQGFEEDDRRRIGADGPPRALGLPDRFRPGPNTHGTVYRPPPPTNGGIQGNVRREERFDQLGQSGAGQGFLTPFGETTPQRFRNRPDQIGGSGAAAFEEFKGQDPLNVYKDVVDKASLGIRKNDFLDMSPFQQFMLNERSKRKLGIKGRTRRPGPGRPPKRRPLPPFPMFDKSRGRHTGNDAANRRLSQARIEEMKRLRSEQIPDGFGGGVLPRFRPNGR